MSCKEENDLIFWSKWYPDMQRRDETDEQFCRRRSFTLTKEEKKKEADFCKLTRASNLSMLKKFRQEKADLIKKQSAEAKAELKLQKELQKKKDKEDKEKAKWDGLQQKIAIKEMQKKKSKEDREHANWDGMQQTKKIKEILKSEKAKTPKPKAQTVVYEDNEVPKKRKYKIQEEEEELTDIEKKQKALEQQANIHGKGRGKKKYYH